ncbi:MAG: penicillin-binding protein 2, partial [Chitinivibrionales bacterium]|nr:penicillin-binding protein 2 [Chitinivibrionales bacterium]
MHINRVRVYVCLALLIAALATIIGRLVVIQIVQGHSYAECSRNQSQQRSVLIAHRGSICDTKGEILATSIERHPPEPKARKGKGVGSEASNADSAGTLAPLSNRVYPFGEIGASVLGYIGHDGFGLGGAELAFDRFLRGENGWAILQKDGRNKKYRNENLPQKIPQNGATVYLTIDADIQKIVFHVLQQTVGSLHALGGMAMVMDPKTGRILAMANVPSFNPNNVARFPLTLRQNRCISNNYEPGSTFKLITAATALTENIESEHDMIDGLNGRYIIGDQAIRDHKAYGLLSFTQALAYSSNVCFAQIAHKIGAARLYKYIRDFGFGAPAGIALPGEEGGIVHPLDKWSPRTHVTVAIGQEISVTFLQMMLVYSAIANNGVLLKPVIVDKIIGADGRLLDSAHYEPLRQVVTPAIAARLRTMLVEVVKQGTGVRAALSGIAVAGKTGTGQKIDSATGQYSDRRVWASFIGFL